MSVASFIDSLIDSLKARFAAGERPQVRAAQNAMMVKAQNARRFQRTHPLGDGNRRAYPDFVIVSEPVLQIADRLRNPRKIMRGLDGRVFRALQSRVGWRLRQLRGDRWLYGMARFHKTRGWRLTEHEFARRIDAVVQPWKKAWLQRLEDAEAARQQALKATTAPGWAP